MHFVEEACAAERTSSHLVILLRLIGIVELWSVKKTLLSPCVQTVCAHLRQGMSQSGKTHQEQ